MILYDDKNLEKYMLSIISVFNGGITLDYLDGLPVNKIIEYGKEAENLINKSKAVKKNVF